MILDYRLTDPPYSGGVIIKHEGTDLSAPWAHLSIIDFARSLKDIAQTISEARKAGYEFIGSNAAIDFLYQNGTVTISANYNSGAIIHVPYIELLAAVDEFYKKVTADFIG